MFSGLAIFRDVNRRLAVEQALGDSLNFERALVDSNRALAVIGTPDQVLSRLRVLANEVGADEVMVSSNIYDPVERLRSYALLRGGEL